MKAFEPLVFRRRKFSNGQTVSRCMQRSEFTVGWPKYSKHFFKPVLKYRSGCAPSLVSLLGRLDRFILQYLFLHRLTENKTCII
ncbi:unnamed protein product [Schistosoma haematobium]|nr:unnamed protein product [Schistosoma haematobium]